MTKITAIIPTLNEEGRIEKALQSVAFADEIIVIDSFSTDSTIALVKKTNAKVIQRTFDNFSDQKNYAIAQAKHDWIFVLDADELLSPSLQEEIKSLNLETTQNVGFYIYRTFFFKETPLQFSGWQRDRVIRLFHRKYCSYKGLVHEQISTNGPVGVLRNKIQHYSFVNTQQYLEKLKLYGKLQAKERIDKHQWVTPIHLYIKPIIRFFIQFIIKLGFLDGWRGLQISSLHAKGVYYRYKAFFDLIASIKTIKPSFDSSLTKKENTLSVIIVNYKSWKVLKPCLDSLSLSSPSVKLDIVVVDNQSNDGRVKEFSEAYPHIRFIENTGNNGFANACNLGASQAEGDTILFLNPDTVVNEQALMAMYNYQKENPTVGMVSCKQKNPNGSYEKIIRHFPKASTLFGFFRMFISNKTLPKTTVYEPDWVSGSLMMMTWQHFAAVDGFNEKYWMYYEDVDLCKKVQDSIGKIVLLDTVEIEHHHGGASRINFSTASMTKTEVLISKHVYLRTHFKGMVFGLLATMVVVQTLCSSLLFSVLALPLFFIRKARLQWYIAIKMLNYYIHVLFHGTWLSPRALQTLLKKVL